MNIKCKIIFLLLPVIFFFAIFEANGQDRKWTKQDTCLSYLEQYSSYWEKDNLGKNGARELMAKFFLRECEFAQNKWTDIIKFLGDPNVSLSEKNRRIYFYRVNYQSADIKEDGTILLRVEVDNAATITGFTIATND